MRRKKRVLVIGANSGVAKALCPKVKGEFELVGTYFKNAPDRDYFSRLIKVNLLLKHLGQLKKELLLADEIVFTAGYYLPKHSNKEILDSNFTSLKNVVDLYESLKLKSRFIFLSSSGVYSTSKSNLIAERSRRISNSVYGKAKILAEDYLKHSQVPYVILRPTMIFGKNFSHTFKQLESNLLQNRIFVYGKGNNWCTYTYEEDLVKVIRKVLLSDIVNDDFNVCNPPIKQLDFWKTLMQIYSIKDISYLEKQDALSDLAHPFDKGFIVRMTRSRVFNCKKVESALKIKLGNNFNKAAQETFK